MYDSHEKGGLIDGQCKKLHLNQKRNLNQDQNTLEF